jgi:hypothetical protein
MSLHIFDIDTFEKYRFVFFFSFHFFSFLRFFVQYSLHGSYVYFLKVRYRLCLFGQKQRRSDTLLLNSVRKCTMLVFLITVYIYCV